MTAELTSLEGCRQKLHVELPAEDVVASYKKILSSYQRHAEIPGFRKGKVPAQTIEQRFSSQIAEDLTQEMTRKGYQQSTKEKDLKVAEIVDIDNVNVSKTEGFSADYTLDLDPEFEVPAYEEIPVTFEKAEVTDADLDERLEELRQNSATMQPAEEGHVIVAGDLVQASLAGSADGGPIDELVGEDHKALASTNTAWGKADADYGTYPGFGKAVVGLKLNDTVEFDALFADDYYVEPLRGKTVHYKGTIQKVSSPVVPEINEEFCKRFGAESPEALRTLLRNYMEAQAKDANLSRQAEAICQYFLQNASFDVPKSHVERESRAIIQETISSGIRQGADKDEILKDKDKILADAEKLATERIRVSYILKKIAKAQDFSVSQSTLRKRVAEIAASNKTSVDKMWSDLERRGSLANLHDAILCEQTIDWLRDHTKEA